MMKDQARINSKETHSEGSLTKNIEQKTAKAPSDFFLFTAIGSMAISAALEFTGHHD